MKSLHNFVIICLTAISIVAPTVNGYAQTRTDSQPKEQVIRIKGKGNAMDTVIRRKAELSVPKSFRSNYTRDESVVQVLRPRLVQQIVDPGNHSHPIYLEHMADGRQKLPEVKQGLLRAIETDSSKRRHMAIQNIADEADLNAITFMHIPVYYLTPNVVFYQDGENVAKYYNLATGALKYLMLRNNTLIGYLSFINGKSYVAWMPGFTTGGYDQIEKLGKNPVVLDLGIGTLEQKKMSGGINLFGYMEQGQLIYSSCDEAAIRLIPTDAIIINPDTYYRKYYALETAESFLFGRERGGLPTIQRWLEDAVNKLNKR
ncbi:hypothetical protein [Pedobacter frigoris]|uniref:Uncharacterized protein n=1 Tax=Pedobacter frigoris TaxID=2571272 RepID=A0A4U1CUJ1_9SPHI|nr:hypothetical protein [Pedobacter frigoris]TKC09689.1 hypothetical protein FA047_06315 [Pedobacter frigoris]